VYPTDPVGTTAINPLSKSIKAIYQLTTSWKVHLNWQELIFFFCFAKQQMGEAGFVQCNQKQVLNLNITLNTCAYLWNSCGVKI